jgi:sugar phosphate isomerase/epimerase
LLHKNPIFGKEMNVLHKLGIQTFTVREDLDRDMPGTLRALKSLGYDGAELYSAHYRCCPERLAEALQEAGMTLTGWHTTAEALMDDLPRTIDANRRAGSSHILLYRLPPMMMYSLDALKAAAKWLDGITARVSDAGLTFGLHNYSPEMFYPIGGVSAWDYCNEHCDERMAMQLDVCTASMARQNLPALMDGCAKRLYSTHMKPYTVGFADPHAGTVPMIGEDSVDYRAVLETGARAGVAWHLAEYESRVRYTPMYAAELCIQKLKERGF